MKLKVISLIIFILGLNGCSLQKLTVKTIHPIIQNSLTALFEEADLALARTAIESDLKLLEGLLKSDPENQKLLLYATQGFTSYALGFVEDEDQDRARGFYERAWQYGLRALRQDKKLSRGLSGNQDEFQQALNSLQKKDVPILFWTANAWGSWINLNLAQPAALADLPRVEAMMTRVLALDPGYYFGGAHLFLGTIAAVKPLIMGGNLEKSKVHFDQCLAFGRTQFLLPYIYYARYYAVLSLDAALFDSLLTKVDTTSIQILPAQRLPNAIAKKKAQRLRQLKPELF
ncbi:TRAP transporter TatT component family protein [candidate division KSB1 bacterium]|nr:TRAP transporter TatT component family protein [candidate division KSB1 bacterium]